MLRCIVYSSFDVRLITDVSLPTSHPPPVQPLPRFSDLQLKSLPTYRRARLSERVEQAIEKSCPLQMMTVQVGRVFLIIFF